MNRRVQIYCAWAGPVLVVLAGLGLTVFAQLIPANSPDASAGQIAREYVDNEVGIRIGLSMTMYAMGLLVPWGIAVATQLRRAVPQHPVLFHIQVACSIGGTMLGVMFVLAGGLAAFRAGEIAPETTQLLNDLMWFCWVFPGSYFIVWNVAVGAGVLLDRHEEPVFPRWAGYVSIWAALLYVPGFLGIFFKTGPFAYNGVFVWWLPTVAFFAWIVLMAGLTIRAINRQPGGDGDDLSITDPVVAAELAQVRAELASLRSLYSGADA
jgi:hypothetical protein